ncbi:C-terminal binding protein 2, isoform CRA_a [Mus musculus]|nr:C-terminal binding protein 2, isoform CRA_a [Mus musculus]
MALVDKHKVKRQRLDRICEAGTSILAVLRAGMLLAGMRALGRMLDLQGGEVL